MTGARTDRRELFKLLKAIAPGDVVTVTRIDRLARSTFDLFAIVKQIVDAKAQFRSLAEPWADTATSTGRLMIAVLGGLADVERDLIRTRTAEGSSRAKARGQHMGRPPKLTPRRRKHGGGGIERVIAVAQLAGAHDFIIELPDGYDTMVGERGGTLSGGQRQRIAIARALITDPRLLIFDEATSALDYESERVIQQNMGQIGKDRTVFIIAHRLSSVRLADRIITLERGRLVEDGTHDELIRKAAAMRHCTACRPACRLSRRR